MLNSKLVKVILRVLHKYINYVVLCTRPERRIAHLVFSWCHYDGRGNMIKLFSRCLLVPSNILSMPLAVVQLTLFRDRKRANSFLGCWCNLDAIAVWQWVDIWHLNIVTGSKYPWAGPGPQETGRGRVRLRVKPTVRDNSPERPGQCLMSVSVSHHSCDFLESLSWTVWVRHVSPAPRVGVSARVAPCQRGHVRNMARTGDREEEGTLVVLWEISSGLTETGIIHTTLTRIKVKFCSSISMFHCSPEMFNFKFRHLIKWRSSSPFMFYVQQEWNSSKQQHIFFRWSPSRQIFLQEIVTKWGGVYTRRLLRIQNPDNKSRPGPRSGRGEYRWLWHGWRGSGEAPSAGRGSRGHGYRVRRGENIMRKNI